MVAEYEWNYQVASDDQIEEVLLGIKVAAAVVVVAEVVLVLEAVEVHLMMTTVCPEGQGNTVFIGSFCELKDGFFFFRYNKAKIFQTNLELRLQ